MPRGSARVSARWRRARRCHGGRRAGRRWCRPSSARRNSRRRISACCSGVIIAGLRGHATDRPVRWKEPRASAATDHASRRPQPGAGRPGIRRRVRGQCARARRAAGSLIPHAGAVRALVIAMIEAAFRAASGDGDVAASARTPGGAARRHAARAVRVAAIARRRRSRTGGCSAGRSSDEAARPRRRSAGLRLDNRPETVAQRA